MVRQGRGGVTRQGGEESGSMCRAQVLSGRENGRGLIMDGSASCPVAESERCSAVNRCTGSGLIG